MGKQNKKNKKANNIGTGMHTVSYLSQQYVQSDYEKNLTLQEIVENQEKHIMLVPRSEEDREYIKQLEATIVKDIPDEVLLKKCEEYFTRGHRGTINVDEDEISAMFNIVYCKRSDSKTEPFTIEEKLNLRCHCHNCDSNFPLRNLKWVDSGKKSQPLLHTNAETLEDLHWSLTENKFSDEPLNPRVIEIIKKVKNNRDADIYSGAINNDYYGIKPMCAKYPVCPSSWSVFDLWLKKEQYSLEDHKKGKYDY